MKEKDANKIKYILQHQKLYLKVPDQLTIGIYANFRPICYKKNGKFYGFDVAIIKKYCKIIGLKPVFKEVKHFQDIWFLPSQRLFDICIGGIGISDLRTNKKTEWSIPYFYVERTVLYNKQNPIHNFPIDVTGIIRATNGSIGHIDGNKKIKEFNKSIKIITSSDENKDLSDLRSGKIQGLLRGSFVAKALLKKYPDLAIHKPWKADSSIISDDNEVFAYPCKLGSGISKSLDIFLTFIILSGELEKLRQIYL